MDDSRLGNRHKVRGILHLPGQASASATKAETLAGDDDQEHRL